MRRASDRTGRVVNEGFHARVYAAVAQIPRGQVATYGQIATLLGSPRVARHVGWAMSACAETEPPVPWHRVINAQGRISGRGELMRAELQRERLEAEGVVFDDLGRVALQEFRWSAKGFELAEEPVDPG